MSNENGANTGTETPPASPAENTPPEETQTQTPPAGEQNTEPGEVPFHKNPAIQDYITRQVANGVKEALVAAGVIKTDPAPATDPLDEDAAELAKEFEIHPDKAKKLANIMNRVADKKNRDLQKKVEQFDLTFRFGALFKSNPDAGQYQGKMQDVFKGLSELEKNFVLNSPGGPAWLLNQAKQNSVAATPPEVRHAAGGGASPRGPSPAIKLGGGAGGDMAKAVDALRKGDRAEYERLVAIAIKQRR